MPNRNQKKHIKPKKIKINAQEYAKEFVINSGNKITAHSTALKLRDASKENKDVYNFWDNIAGHILKVNYS